MKVEENLEDAVDVKLSGRERFDSKKKAAYDLLIYVIHKSHYSVNTSEFWQMAEEHNNWIGEYVKK